MKWAGTGIEGLLVAQSPVHGDARGAFTRLFCEHSLQSVLGNRHIVQINHSRTTIVGTVRGLHFQRSPAAEAKLVHCLQGAVWDVVVDLRPGSPTHLQWHAELLSADNGCALLIPPGCAHGFQTQEDDVHMLYVHSAAHAPAHEGGLHPLDARLAIAWPLPVQNLSVRDQAHPPLPATGPAHFGDFS